MSCVVLCYVLCLLFCVLCSVFCLLVSPFLSSLMIHYDDFMWCVEVCLLCVEFNYVEFNSSLGADCQCNKVSISCEV